MCGGDLLIIVRPIPPTVEKTLAASGGSDDAAESPDVEDLQVGTTDTAPAMCEEELDALMQELELEAENISPEEEAALQSQCYKETVESVLECENIQDVETVLEHYESIIAPGDPFAIGQLQCLHDIKNERQRAAEIDSMQLGDIHLSFTANTAPSVKELKAKIQEARCIPAAHQRLVFAGKELASRNTLASYQITAGAVVFLVLRKPLCLQLLVQLTHTEESFSLQNVTADATVEEIKSKIQQQEGIIAQNQTLVFAGKVLVGDDSLSEHGIGINSASCTAAGEDLSTKLHLVLIRFNVSKVSTCCCWYLERERN